MAFTYRIVNDYRAGIPQTPLGAVGKFKMVALHDTEGGVGTAGALGTIQFLIDRADRNASYHEIWSWTESTKTFVVHRIVRTTSAAHSVNPTPPSYAPDALVRAALGVNVNDPNRFIYAVSLAGKVADVNRWSLDADFVAACRRRLAEIKTELGVSAKGEHFRINPSTRTDWGKMLTAAIDGRVIGDDMQFWRPVQEDWTTKVGAAFWDGAGNAKNFTSSERVRSIAESSDGTYRLVRYGTSELLVIERAGLTPISGTRVPTAPAYGFPPPETITVEKPTGITQTQLDAAVADALVDGEVVGVRKEKSRLRTLLGL